MSASVSSPQNSNSAAAAAAAAQAVAANATASSASATNSSTSGGSNSLASLSSNFNDFLNLLMTQLQNQNPTSPMNTDQFTSELVQFTGVEQQINTNGSLTKLIQLTQGDEMLQASSIVGKTVDVNTNQLPLQNGSATLTFTTTAAEPVSIAIYNSSGQEVNNYSVQATQGANTWTWNGQSSSGTTEPNGAYTVAIYGGANGATPTAVPFTVQGTVTGVSSQTAGTVDLQMGGASTSMGNVQQVVN
jgi:flagellar basal-body rod modification protein FlgD